MKPRNHVAAAQQSGAGRHTPKKFKVRIQYTVWEEAEIEAEDEDDAYQQVLDDEGEIDYEEIERGNWEFLDAEEIKDEKAN